MKVAEGIALSIIVSGLSRLYGDNLEGLVETGKAITLAAMSTIIGFGSLSQSHFPGLSSMGKVAILGAMSTCIVAITVLPAFLTWMESTRSDE